MGRESRRTAEDIQLDYVNLNRRIRVNERMPQEAYRRQGGGRQSGQARPSGRRDGGQNRDMQRRRPVEQGAHRAAPGAYRTASGTYRAASGTKRIDVPDTVRPAPRRNPYLYEEPPREQGRKAARRPAARRRKKSRFGALKRLLGGVVGIAAVILLFIFFFMDTGKAGAGKADGQDAAAGGPVKGAETFLETSRVQAEKPAWTEDFLSVSEWARPGQPLPEVKNIFVHYTANKGTSAAQNRSYFEGLKDSHETAASAHFIIGYEGEIINCVPVSEVAYAVSGRNFDSISIECCYLADDGSFTRETYDSLIRLLRWLLDTYQLDSDDILRHYDSNGKKCPIYYVENEDAWEQLKRDVDDRQAAGQNPDV